MLHDTQLATRQPCACGHMWHSGTPRRAVQTPSIEDTRVCQLEGRGRGAAVGGGTASHSSGTGKEQEKGINGHVAVGQEREEDEEKWSK